MTYKCPQCGEEKNLEVAVVVYASLIQTEGSEVRTCIHPSDYRDWDAESMMRCPCGWSGRAREARLNEYEVSIRYYLSTRVHASDRDAADRLARDIIESSTTVQPWIQMRCDDVYDTHIVT